MITDQLSAALSIGGDGCSIKAADGAEVTESVVGEEEKTCTWLR